MIFRKNLMTQFFGRLHGQEYLAGCSGLAHSGFGRQANHHDGDSRRTPRSRPWTAGENEREPCPNIPKIACSCFINQLKKLRS